MSQYAEWILEAPTRKWKWLLCSVVHREGKHDKDLGRSVWEARMEMDFNLKRVRLMVFKTAGSSYNPLQSLPSSPKMLTSSYAKLVK